MSEDEHLDMLGSRPIEPDGDEGCR